MLPKSPELLVLAVAIARTGGVVLPLFTAFEKDAAEYRVLDSAAKLIVTDTEHAHKFDGIMQLSGHSVATACSIVSASDATVVQLFPRDSEPVMQGNDLLAVVYTSGTTGQPKGRLHTNQSNVF